MTHRNDVIRYNAGPIMSADIYNGEIYNASMETLGWTLPTYDASCWPLATSETVPSSFVQVTSHTVLPNIRITESFPACTYSSVIVVTYDSMSHTCDSVSHTYGSMPPCHSRTYDSMSHTYGSMSHTHGSMCRCMCVCVSVYECLLCTCCRC